MTNTDDLLPPPPPLPVEDDTIEYNIDKEYEAENRRKILASSGNKVSQNHQPPSSPTTPSPSVNNNNNNKKKPTTKTTKAKPVSTTEKRTMENVTVRSIVNDTGVTEVDWPLFALKEQLDNVWDWLNEDNHYPAINSNSKSVRKIGVRIWITHHHEDNQNIRFIHIAVRNSNVRNIPVFQDLKEIFDFNVMHSTKRNQHRMTCGSLGDALKRSLGMGYALWTRDYNAAESFDDKQWEQPVIVRCNGKEFRVYIKVDSARQELWIEGADEEIKHSRDIGNDTEVEITLPILNSPDVLINELSEYHRKYKIGKTMRTEFSFSIETAAGEGEVKQQQ